MRLRVPWRVAVAVKVWASEDNLRGVAVVAVGSRADIPRRPLADAPYPGNRRPYRPRR